jgi:hypothetical protein
MAYQMVTIEGPDRGQRHYASISTHRQRRQRRAPRTSDETDLPESARAHQTRLQNSDGLARA